jgi:Mrp family chromosome partitioning ATPase
MADQDLAVTESLAKIKNKFIVMSGKGGVGKTSTSVNLAIAVSNRGYRVGIIDVDLHGPDVPRMLGLEGMPQVNENKKLEPLKYSDTLSVISIEVLTPKKR